MATAEETVSALLPPKTTVAGIITGSTNKPHGNKHGKDRGLDRANDVAGEHGQQGRANAATHQSDNDSGSDPE
jgi:hypothetical protein